LFFVLFIFYLFFFCFNNLFIYLYLSIYLFCFLYFFQHSAFSVTDSIFSNIIEYAYGGGIFSIESDLYPSCIINTTFKNISDPSLFTDGGVLFVNTSSYTNFTIDRCIFSFCNGYYGGAIYLDSLSPSIVINRCRFENNRATYGTDIYVFSSKCFSPNTITNSCTTSRINNTFCSLVSFSGFLTSCLREIV
jgi:hypothetical protein